MARVLVVDDSPEIRLYLRTVLKASNHQVVEAPDGAVALELARGGKIDAIISDGLMPNMDGFRLCLECKRDEKLRGLPFVFYTASYSTPEDQAYGSSLGADAYLLKPTEPMLILETVDGLLSTPRPLDAETSEEIDLPALLEEYGNRIESKLDRKVAQLSEARSDLASLRAVLDDLPLLVVTLDTGLAVDFLNRAAGRFLGDVPEDTTTLQSLLGLEPDTWKLASEACGVALAEGRPGEFDLVAQRYDGRRRRIRLSVIPHRDRADEITGLILAGQDVTEAEEHQEFLLFLAEHDILTGLPNRRVLDAAFESALAKVRSGQSSALLFIDIDRFKSVNDEHGHDVGDAVLTGVATIIFGTVGSRGLVVRLCGDEFAVLVEGADREDAYALAEQVREAVASARLVPGVPDRRITVSIGINVVPDCSNSDEALRAADAAMYEAKGCGRDRSVLAQGAEAGGDDAGHAPHVRPVLTFVPSYSTRNGSLNRVSVVSEFAIDGALMSADEAHARLKSCGLPRRLSLDVIESAVDQMAGSDAYCGVRLSLADVLDPSLFNRAEAIARQRDVDARRLSFILPIGHLFAGLLPSVFAKAAERSLIRMVLDACDAKPGQILNAANAPFREVEVSSRLLADANDPSIPRLFEVLAERGMTSVVVGVPDCECLQRARTAGAENVNGPVLVDAANTLAVIPQQVRLETHE